MTSGPFTSLDVNNVTYDYPLTGANAWGEDASNWAIAVTNGMLQKKGGSFTLTAETDFGPNYGLKTSYVKSRTVASAVAGVLRMAHTDTINWRNAANDGDNTIGFDAFGQLLVNGAPFTGNTVGHFLSIVDYGADPSGVADSTASIQACINAASLISAYVYIPYGTYKISAPLVNTSAPNCMGFFGDGNRLSILSGTTLTSHGIDFLNLPIGFLLEDFQILGPGQTYGGTAIGINLRSDPGQIIYQLSCKRVMVAEFPTAGLYAKTPIVSVFEGNVAQLCGDNGFHIDGGTSLSFISNYANAILSKGYYIFNVVYSSFTGNAADNCNDSYYFYQCGGISMTGNGSEEATYVSPSLPGRAVVYDTCFGMSNSAQWTYFASNVASLQFHIIGSAGVTISSCLVVPEVILTTADIKIESSAPVTITNCRAFGHPNDEAIVVSDSSGNLVVNGDSFSSVIVPFLELTGTNGSGQSLTAPGTVAIGGDLTITTADNPQLVLNNTSNSQSWVVSGDNDDGLAIYDATNALTIGYFYPRNGVSGQDGNLYLAAGLLVNEGVYSFTESGDITAATLDITTINADTINSTVGGNVVLDSATVNGTVQTETIQLAGTAIPNANVTLTGWDTTTINYVSAFNSGGGVGLNVSGAPSANPLVRVTFTGGGFPFIPTIHITTYATPDNPGFWMLTDQQATYFEVRYIGTPNAGFSTGFNFFVTLV